jgi:hypothetical protein
MSITQTTRAPLRTNSELPRGARSTAYNLWSVLKTMHLWVPHCFFVILISTLQILLTY